MFTVALAGRFDPPASVYEPGMLKNQATGTVRAQALDL